MAAILKATWKVNQFLRHIQGLFSENFVELLSVIHEIFCQQTKHLNTHTRAFAFWFVETFIKRFSMRLSVVDVKAVVLVRLHVIRGPVWEAVMKDKLNSSSLKQSQLKFTAAFIAWRIMITVNFDLAACNLIVRGRTSSCCVLFVSDPPRQTINSLGEESLNQVKSFPVKTNMWCFCSSCCSARSTTPTPCLSVGQLVKWS